MFRILTLAAIGAAAVVGAAALSASAQPAAGGPEAAAGPGGPAMMVMMRHHLAAMDKNGDGFITRDEFMVHPSEMFAKLDANGDGRISKEEMAAAPGLHQVCKRQEPGDAAPRDVPCGDIAAGHMGGHMGGPHMAMMIAHHMDKLDADHDGRISLAELEAPLRRHFEMMDKNKDGFIEKDEMPGDGGVMIEKHIETHP
jgi:hypothetical protein